MSQYVITYIREKAEQLRKLADQAKLVIANS